MDFTASSMITVAACLAYAVMIYLVIRYQDSTEKPIIRLLIATLSLGLLGTAAALLPSDTRLLNQDALSQPALQVYVISLFLVAYSVLTTAYLQQKEALRIWLSAGLLWWGVLFLTSLNDTPFLSTEWFDQVVEEGGTPGLVAIGGWLALSLLLLWNTFWKFYTARLPELANQALFWAVIMPLVVVGAMLNASNIELLREMGIIIQVVGVAGATYGVIALRVLDIRATLRTAAVNMSMILITTIAVLAALLIAEAINDETNVNRQVILAGLALVTATLHAPIYVGAEYLTNRLLRQRTGNVSGQISRFSEGITGIVELNELATLVSETLNETLQVRRSDLLLCTTDENDPNLLRVEPHHANQSDKTPLLVLGYLRKDGILYKRFFESRKPILQYAIDFSREFAEIDAGERQFLQKMRMAIYTPIVVHEQLIGILATGPKSNDAPFSDGDLDLLSAFANQTGIALRNARLVDDLRKREHDLEKSNKDLESAKRRLEAMDAVKTDFITIASHELRTPLAQIRGHSDIMGALGEQGALTPDHLSSLTGNLRKATDRLETLIGDMLDVSRLDLSALDLRFTQTSIENVVRLAIEPLQDDIRARKQSLTAKGLRNLPQVEADTKRLVQAVRNLVLNAVKYTPDGGRIDIFGELLNNAETGKDEIQLTVRDSGIGIDKKNHEAIFEKFFRVGDPGLHSTGTTKFMGAGPGLGLTIARGVVEGHGGRIWVESEGNDTEKLPGSIFYMILPIKPPEGSRRVMSFGTTEAMAVSAVVASSNGSPATDEEDAKKEAAKAEPVFEETDPTVLNPSASRAGLASAAIAAVQGSKPDSENEERMQKQSKAPNEEAPKRKDDNPK